MTKNQEYRFRAVPAVLRLCVLCLICALVIGLFAGCSKDQNTDTASTSEETQTESAPASEPDSGEPVETESNPVPEPTEDPTVDYEGLNTKQVYMVDELAADDPRQDLVVAQSNGLTLTNRQLQMYFYMQYYGYMNQMYQYMMYGYDISAHIPDTTKPLSEQACSEVGGLTWEQYFLLCAIRQFQQTVALTAAGHEAGYEISEEDAAELQEVKDGLAEQAEHYGFESIDDYIQASFGPGVKQQDYEEYLDLYFYAVCYEDAYYSDITWTDDDLLEFFRNNPDMYEGIPELPNVNVRHILIPFEDSDGDSATSEEEKAAALALAESLLESYAKNPTEENFAALANENSTDGGSNTKGGLYEDVYPGQMVPTFNDWCFDASRKNGDTGIVESTYGYHVMYYVGQTQNYYWKSLAEQDYPQSRLDTMIDEYMNALEMEVAYDAIVIGPMPEAAGEEEE